MKLSPQLTLNLKAGHTLHLSPFDSRVFTAYKDSDANTKGANDMTNLNIRNYNEKRDFIRMKVDTEVTLTLDGTNEQVTAFCRDLSGTGMLIETNQAIEEGTVCDTRLPSNNEAFPALDARVKVLRCTPAEIIEIGI